MEELRRDFPILETGIIYFDNAATTHKPVQVIEAITNFYREHNSNVHRGIHKLARCEFSVSVSSSLKTKLPEIKVL